MTNEFKANLTAACIDVVQSDCGEKEAVRLIELVFNAPMSEMPEIALPSSMTSGEIVASIMEAKRVSP